MPKDHALALDRFEGDRKQIAVLLDSQDRPIAVPRDLLPRGAKAGDILTLRLERDEAATTKLVAQTRKVEEELDRRDPGGDVKI